MSKKQMTRDELRAKLFKSRKLKTKTISLFGVDVEVRQPSLRGILDQQAAENNKAGLLLSLTTFCFVPGTDELLFEEADTEALLNMPFDEDMVTLNEAIESLTGVDVAGETGNSNATG